MKESLFEIGDDSCSKLHWTRAPSVHPTSEVIQWSCDICGRATTYPSGSFDLTVEGGSAFPDCLLCGFYPFFVVSERVAVAAKSSGISSFTEFPVRVVNCLETDLVVADAPKYFRIEVTGECKVDLFTSGARVKGVCSRCGAITIERPGKRRFRLLQGSWDGCDLFRDVRLFPRVIFCTQKVVSLVQTAGYTNFRFDPID
jgi:hypothetical protein